MKDWVKIFKALGNEKRLGVIKVLSKQKELPVTEIAKRIRLSVKSTSKHLIHLTNLNILESNGREGKVYYSFSPTINKKIKSILKVFLP